MAIYAIGDVQGCFDELMSLLQLIQFNPQQDNLWFTGDLVNRGTQSLDVLRFVKQLGHRAITVLGNHDLHLLAVVNGSTNLKSQDTFVDILQAPDQNELCLWLSQQPLLHHDPILGFTLVHAGIPPQWQITQALVYAREVQQIIQSAKAKDFFKVMYGDEPNLWSDQLQGFARYRLITNYLTRMRYCDLAGKLNLTLKGSSAKKNGLMPWFKVPNRFSKGEKIIFGHWAAINGETNEENTYALDTGCIWGNCLTAMRLNDLQRFTVPCHQRAR